MEFYLLSLCFLFCLSGQFLLNLPFATAQLCRPAQSDALLQFSNSLAVQTDTDPPCHPKTIAWKNGLDCCSWAGVTCDNITGNVIGLDLSSSCLQGILHSDSSLFALRRLQSLSLAFNDFRASPISPELSVFTELRLLNLSSSNFSGPVPVEISYLSKLVLLDLSGNNSYNGYGTFRVKIENTSFKILVQNLTELRELHLDEVNMSFVSPSSFVNLSSSLTVFSASWCDLRGELPPNIFRLPNLLDLHLDYNFEIKVSFPKSNWSKSLESLTLSSTNVSGKIADSIGELKNLHTLDLSFCNLIGPIPPLLANLTKLTMLDLSSNELTGHILSSIGKLEQLVVLDLAFNEFSGVLDVGVLSTLKNLQYLGLRVELNLASNRMNFTFPKLETLVLPFCNLTKFPLFLKSLKKLKYLDLSENKIGGQIPRWFFDVGEGTLEFLDISSNLIEGGLRPFPWKELIDVDLGENLFQGPLPIPPLSICSFWAARNGFSGEIPSSICKLSSLESLHLAGNNLSGSIPQCLGNLTNLKMLRLSANQFEGTLPWSLGNLTNLERLDLNDNHFEGTLPRFLGNLINLWLLDMSANQFEGTLPWFLGHLTNLQCLYLSANHFEGTLPWFLGNLNNLRWLALSANQFEGTLPQFLGNLTNLWSLDLSANQFEGTLPWFLGNLTNLQWLDLSANQFEGTLLRSFENCALLRYLNVSFNKINDTFPKWLLESPSLESIDLQFNQFHGQIVPPTPPSFDSQLDTFSISNNNLGGQWPEEYFLHLSNLQTVDLSNNRFEGPMPIPPLETFFYSIANNKISGKVSPLICKATDAVVLNLSNNSLMGTLPECLMNFSDDLSVLHLRMNKFRGVIPRKLVTDNKLKTIDFSGNRFEGTLPRSLRYCKNLEVLDLGNNGLEDTFPDWLGTLPKLRVLVLRSNKFHGSLSSPKPTRAFSELRIFDLSNNNLTGPFPVRYIMKFTAMMNQDTRPDKLQYMGGAYYQDSVTVTMKGIEIRLVKILTVFVSIDLSSNRFVGELPVDIGNLKSLKGLNLSHNNLTGSMPSSFGNLTELEWLDLSSNKFTGKIPQELADLTSLEILNLSDNQLIGPIPRGSQFNTFKSDSFVKNPGLCGFPLLETCANGSQEISPVTIPQEKETEHEGWFEWRAILMGYGCGVVAGISLGYILLESKRFQWLAELLEKKGAKMRRKWRRNARRSYQI